MTSVLPAKRESTRKRSEPFLTGTMTTRQRFITFEVHCESAPQSQDPTVMVKAVDGTSRAKTLKNAADHKRKEA
jgi:hypothetical protein